MAEAVNALYIEDDAGLAFLLSDSLADADISITHAPNGHAGMELFHEETFDVVLVDHEMPGLSGIDVIQQMQFTDNPPPIIMVTGSGNERVAVRAMQVGASDYVVKDVSMGYIELLPRVMHQVLDQRRLEIEHERARQLLETEKLKTELIRDFIEKASHEFRTPISVIQTACYMIGRIDDPQKRQYYLNRIQDKSEGITKLVDNLVLLMKLDARYDLTLQSIYLRDIIDATVETLSQSYQDKYINIVVDNQTPKTKVVGDIDLLRRAIREVLDNACRYSYDESTVNMTVTGDAHTVSIVVEDNGIGIAEENLPKIFDRFYRVDEAHSTQGFGLGLSIASRIIDLTCGDITVQSELGVGTTVTLELPSNIMSLA